jgi:hypothetical protein
MDNITVQLANDAKATISVFENRLIMLHSDCICSQWQIDQTGVRLTPQDKDTIKLAFMHIGCSSGCHQSFYFKTESFDSIETFFKSYGFPVPQETIYNSD